jgi:hypothetical protein
MKTILSSIAAGSLLHLPASKRCVPVPDQAAGRTRWSVSIRS